MSGKMIIGWGLGLFCTALVVLGAYVRLAPSDPELWHSMPEQVENRDMEGGAMRVVAAGPNGLSRFDMIARDTPRVKVLVGSVGEGMVTYVARSGFWGFPDYVTARQAGDTLELFSRLRFGRSDFGVNAKRLDNWISQI
ncbi:DUF1499 domain-containing protein [Rhodalgimonas zhirmunskyi]|uniref:DUF1499 domain-containing protein n=1 Tax=Rhodalgimonas zhirmunskyi TaxID=2964767 RepID=A0AAJ1U8G6_9RHOB|nr:DUF1499 domain-containing protein [Rhodoalgimonas zhirmunskyi]MDQ2093228.1 DUF1499 domain-containing protein [Rhodoalgimonas zhirmunskyi]